MNVQGYNTMLDNLKQGMVADYVSVNPEKNPIALNLERFDERQLDFVIGQYSMFPQTIVSMLTKARDNLQQISAAIPGGGMPNVVTELERNIAEEMGSESGGVKHYDILAKALNETLGIDIQAVVPSQETQQFVDMMYGLMGKLCVPTSEAASEIFAATYALEATAVPELQIVQDVVKRAASLKNRQFSSGMKYFFDAHINDFEIGHEEGLRKAAEKYVCGWRPMLPCNGGIHRKMWTDEKQLRKDFVEDEQVLFKKGFTRVMQTMDEWWKSLGREAEALK